MVTVKWRQLFGAPKGVVPVRRCPLFLNVVFCCKITGHRSLGTMKFTSKNTSLGTTEFTFRGTTNNFPGHHQNHVAGLNRKSLHGAPPKFSQDPLHRAIVSVNMWCQFMQISFRNRFGSRPFLPVPRNLNAALRLEVMGRAAGATAQPKPKASPVKRDRHQNGRRDLQSKVERMMRDKVYPRLPKQVVASKKVNGFLIDEYVMDVLVKEGVKRFSPKFWRETLAQYEDTASALAQFKLAEPTQPVSNKLLTALEAATCLDNKQRDPEELIVLLKYGSALNQKE